MDLKGIAVQRLHSQQLAQSSLKLPGEVVSWMVAVQAQDYPGAKWSVGLRLSNSTNAKVEEAIVDKTVLRSWVLRGTLHFVASADIHWLLALLAPRIISGNKRRYEELELDDHTLIRSSDLLVKALQGTAQLTRKELLGILEQNGLSTEGQRGVYMLQRASLDGLICQGAMQRSNPTFMKLDGFPLRILGRDEALAELARRYFTSRGPATLQDFTWWSGLSTSEARAGLDSIQSQLVHETVEGQTFWGSASISKAQDKPPRAYLLPGFDEYLLAYKDRRASLDDPHYGKSTPLNGIFPAAIIINGHVAGTWKRTFKKDSVMIKTVPFSPLTSIEIDGLASAARRFGEFLDLPATLT